VDKAVANSRTPAGPSYSSGTDLEIVRRCSKKQKNSTHPRKSSRTGPSATFPTSVLLQPHPKHSLVSFAVEYIPIYFYVRGYGV
jgi:hypothetical protein